MKKKNQLWFQWGSIPRPAVCETAVMPLHHETIFCYKPKPSIFHSLYVGKGHEYFSVFSFFGGNFFVFENKKVEECRAQRIYQSVEQ